MTYENFLKIILNLQKQDRIIKMNVDLIEFVDPYRTIIQQFITEIYGEKGYDWFSWFCYDNEYGQKGLEAWDENKNPICYGFESLWEYMESIRLNKSQSDDCIKKMVDKLKLEWSPETKTEIGYGQHGSQKGEEIEYTLYYDDYNCKWTSKRNAFWGFVMKHISKFLEN